MNRLLAACGALLLFGAVLAPAAEPAKKDAPDAVSPEVRAAREKGLDWLTKNQAADGSWGKGHSIAVTSFVCLAYLSASNEPYDGERGRTLTKGLRFLLSKQKDGMFAQQGHTWIHGQGFATMTLAEAYGRSLLGKVKPDLDMKKVRAVVVQAVAAIAKHQSTSGGWWYTPGNPGDHEGSTTVCAVQALVSASNYGIAIDEKALDKGFNYLKRSQSKDGGFNYKLGDGTSMKEGTAADVATLGLMQKFDTAVMVKGYQFLIKTTPAVVGAGSFAYYGHFYGCMGMQLLAQEYKADKAFREGTKAYIAGVQKDLLAWQQKDGTWPLKGWVAGSGTEDAKYATAFATLALYVPDARLSVYNRTPPKLPKEADAKKE
jgi:hypothetical protein